MAPRGLRAFEMKCSSGGPEISEVARSAMHKAATLTTKLLVAGTGDVVGRSEGSDVGEYWPWEAPTRSMQLRCSVYQQRAAISIGNQAPDREDECMNRTRVCAKGEVQG
jgi:hypothetical protein